MEVRFTCTTYPYRKFYTIMLAQSLFGPAVIRTWGRIGTAGRSKVDRHETLHDARLALEGRRRTTVIRQSPFASVPADHQAI
jgi:predicted DNA-binding WGR domain protein